MGTTCSGKDTVLNKLLNRGYKKLVSYTTRPMRFGEVDHEAYNFVTKEQFDEDIVNDQVIEHREYNVSDGSTWYYYFRKEELDLTKDNYVCIADVGGTRDLVKYFGEANTKVVLIDTPLQECITRALVRDGTSVLKVKETCRRMVSDIEEFVEEDKAYKLATYVHDNSAMSTDKSFDKLMSLFEYLEGEN